MKFAPPLFLSSLTKGGEGNKNAGLPTSGGTAGAFGRFAKRAPEGYKWEEKNPATPSHPEQREMVAEGSITVWLNRLSEGDTEAAQILWDRFFQRMVRVARSRLAREEGRAGEEEDVALSAFHEFFQAVADDRFARLANRNDLWQVLYLLISRKAVDYYRRARRQKRDDVRTVTLDTDLATSDIDPALTASMADDVRALLDRLPSLELRQVAVLKLDGYTNEEIAEQLNCTIRTIGRRIGLIRSLWSPDEA